MKKYLIAIIIILASVTSIYALNEFLNSNISMDKITQINIYYKSELKDSYNPVKDDAGNYDLEYTNLINALNSMTKIDSSTLSNSNYKIDIIGNGELESYKFNIDKETLEVHVSIDDEVYLISEDMNEYIFNSNFFNEIYYDEFLNSSSFKLGDTTLLASKKGKIAYTTPYGFESSKEIELTSNNILTTINDSKNLNNITIKFEHFPESIIVKAYDKDTLINESMVNSYEFAPIKRDGVTTYKVMASWKNSDSVSIKGDLTYTFDLDVDLSPEFELVANKKGAGEFFVVKALYFNDNEKPLVESDFIKNKHFEKIGDEYLLIIPLNYYQKEASYDIDLSVKIGTENTLIDTKKLIIENRKFTSQSLTIDKSTVAATSTDNAYTEFAKYFTPSREKSNPKAYFTESFMLPIDGRISTQFGMMRYVNGSLTSYRHSGLDIAVPRGTPVPATNTGKIVLARELILTGNTVVIDHGVGLFSVYYHMDTLNVSKDDMVSKADVIGTVGSTGRSTGPHLHFTTSFYKTNMNPNFLISLSSEELENIID